MIDERFLKTLQFVHTVQDKREFIDWANSNENNLKELIRLARLGLWAEKHGIPTLNILKEDLNPIIHNNPNISGFCKRVLAALPKEPRDG